MNNQSGIIIKVNKSEFQLKIIGKDYNKILTNAYITNKLGFQVALQKVFVAKGAYNPSHIFYNFGYKDEIYVKNFSQNIEYRLPVYGVRGAAKTDRITKFAAVYSSLMEDMSGADFFDHVFGTDYLSGEECVQNEENVLIERLDAGCQKVPLYIPAEKRRLVCHTLEKLWSMQEKNNSLKLIILMQDPEKESMDFLKMLYMLIPSRLRFSIGFITNAANADIEMIKEHTLPISILTMSQQELEAVKNLDEKTYQIYDLSKEDSYTYDQKKMEFLERLVSSVSETQDVCLNCAESFVMEEQKCKATQFAIYQTILDKLFASDFFWWNKEKITLLEEVQALWEKQKEMMEVDELREKAIYTFYAKLQKKSDFQKQLMRLIRNKKTEDEQLLEFLKENLFLNPEIEAVSGLIEEMEQEKALLEEKHQAEIIDLQSSHQSEMEDLRSTHQKEVQKLHTKHEESVLKMQTEYDAKLKAHTEKIENLSTEVENKNAEISKQKKENTTQKAFFESEKAKWDEGLKKANSTIVRLENKIRDNDIDQLIAERNHAEDKKHRMEKQRNSARVGRTIFIVTTGLFVIASAGLGYIGYQLNNKNAGLTESNAQIEREKNSWKERYDQREKAYKILDEQKKELETENAAQSERIVELELKNEELLTQQEEYTEESTEDMQSETVEVDYSSLVFDEEGMLVYQGDSDSVRMSWR